MLTKTIHKILFVLVVVLLLLASFFAGRMQNKPTVVRAQEIQGDENRMVSFTCDLINVAAFDNRMHIRCNNYEIIGSDHVNFFAIESTSENEMLSNQVMANSIASLSLDQGTFYLYYDPSESNNPPGCNVNNCRKLLGVSWVKY